MFETITSTRGRVFIFIKSHVKMRFAKVCAQAQTKSAYSFALCAQFAGMLYYPLLFRKIEFAPRRRNRALHDNSARGTYTQ